MEHSGIARPARATSPWLGRLVWFPVPLVGLAAVVLYVQHDTTAHESTVLLATLNTLFCTSASLLIAHLSARTYRMTGSRAALALGCGTLAFGLSELLAGLAVADTGAAVAVHNVGACVAGALFLLSSLAAVRARRASSPSPGPAAGLAYLGVAAALVLVYLGCLAGVVPDFYAARQGFTLLRQGILSLALLEFACASLCFLILYGRLHNPFLKSSAIGLALIGLALLVIIVESAPGTPLSWVGRSGQYLGGLYLLIGAMTVAQGPWGWRIPLEQALQETEQRYEALVEATPDAIVVQHQGRILYANSSALRLFGAGTFEELRAHSAFELVPPELRPQLRARLQQLAAGAAVPRWEMRVLRLDGQTVPAEVESALVTFHGAPAVQAVMRDISERKRAEAALREAKDYLQNLLDYANAPIIVWDRNYRITQFNHAFERLAGYSASEVLSRELDLLFPDDSKEQSLAHIRDAMAGQHWESVEIPIRQKSGGMRTVLWNSATLRTADGSEVVATIAQGQDITERVQAEAERERLLLSERAALEEAEAALRLRDEFLSVAAHELKTPITNLRGYPQLILRRLEKGAISDPAQVRPALETIDREAGKLSSLVSQLLDIARLQGDGLVLDRQAADLAGLAREVVASMRTSPAHEHTLHLQAPETLAGYVDPLRLQQVLVNLIDNAVKFSPDGSAIEVEVASLDPRTVRLSVRDHGPGVPPEERERLFSRYHRAGRRRPAGGLGLGLYISQRIVLAHGGRIEAQFPDDGGTRFVVTLPAQGIGD